MRSQLHDSRGGAQIEDVFESPAPGEGEEGAAEQLKSRDFHPGSGRRHVGFHAGGNPCPTDHCPSHRQRHNARPSGTRAQLTIALGALSCFHAWEIVNDAGFSVKKHRQPEPETHQPACHTVRERLRAAFAGVSTPMNRRSQLPPSCRADQHPYSTLMSYWGEWPELNRRFQGHNLRLFH